MALALVGGMAVSTLMTLFVVPAGYSLLDDGVAWVRARRTQGERPVPGEGAAPRAAGNPGRPG